MCEPNMDWDSNCQKRSKRKSRSKRTASPAPKVIKITNNAPGSVTPKTTHSSLHTAENFLSVAKSISRIDDGIDYFAALPDEVLLMIFKNCSKPTLVNCACVCRRWNHVAFDNDLWTRVDISQRRIAGNMIHILVKKPIVLRMAQTEVSTPLFPNMSANFNHKIEYLDLSMAVILPRDLELLLGNCYSLRKLSLENCELNASICGEIGKNIKLSVLNLSLCTGLNEVGLKSLLKNCQNLIELNIAWTSLNAQAIKTVCQFLSEDILKLNFSGGAKEMTDQHVSSLVFRCNKLRELDLSDATAITGTSVLAICENLKHLQILSLSRCYHIFPTIYTKLFSLPALTHLNIFGLFSDIQVEQFRKMHNGIINQMKFSFIARPTVGDRRTSIWGMPSRDR